MKDLTLKELLTCLKQDFEMLKDGRWEPDKEGCNASLDTVFTIANKLNITL